MYLNNITGFRRLVYTAAVLFASATLTACGGGGGGGSDAGGGGDTGTPTQSQATPIVAPATPVPTPVNTEIKLLVLYSPGVVEQYIDPDLRISHLVNVANDILTDSGVNLTFTVAHQTQVSYPESGPIDQALDDLTYQSHSAFLGVPGLRNTHEADLVVLLRPYANDGRCGYAWVGGDGNNGQLPAATYARFGFSVVGSNCSEYTFMHELGHNMGLVHSQQQAPDGGTFTYSRGHGQHNDFATIMATSGEFNAPRLPLLSNPGLDCNGSPCGVQYNSINGADSVRALSITAPQVAQYR